MAELGLVVVCGPPGSGKSTWVKSKARSGLDLVWDLDLVAGAIAFGGRDVPRDTRGKLPWAIMKATLCMRDAFVGWLSETKLFSACVYIIITNELEAQRVAHKLGAQLIVIKGRAE